MPSNLKNISFLELFILNTVVYFDLFDYPLTANELFTFLYTGGMAGADYSLAEITNAVGNNPKLKKIIATKRGFYFLQGRENIITKRLERYSIADYKFQIVLRAVRLMKYCPFIKLIAVCNNLAYFNARQSSDLDLFIISSPRRIWLVRLVVILMITLLGLRPPKTKAPDKLCLSFYITADNLDLSKVQIVPDDIYLVYWLATLWPVYQQDSYYQKLMQANSWLKKYLPNYETKEIGYRYRVEPTKFSSWVVKVKEKILAGRLGDWANNYAKSLNLKLISQQKKDLAIVSDTRVIINDQMLKFHDRDRRLQYLQQFEAKRQEIIEQI